MYVSYVIYDLFGLTVPSPGHLIGFYVVSHYFGDFKTYKVDFIITYSNRPKMGILTIASSLERPN